jgi:hypothetical protein
MSASPEMRNVLYLVTKDPTQDLLIHNPSPNLTTSVVLLQEAVSLPHVSANHVYALAEDAASRKVTPSVPMVSYQEMLHMIFDADSVVAL